MYAYLCWETEYKCIKLARSILCMHILYEYTLHAQYFVCIYSMNILKQLFMLKFNVLLTTLHDLRVYTLMYCTYEYMSVLYNGTIFIILHTRMQCI